MGRGGDRSDAIEPGSTSGRQAVGVKGRSTVGVIRRRPRILTCLTL